MVEAKGPARPLAAERAPWLRGTIRVPGDREMGALALALAAMARGESVIDALPETSATHTLIAGLKSLGAHIDKRGGRWHVQGIGVGGFLTPEAPIALSGTDTDLLLIGLTGFMDMETRLIPAPTSPAGLALLDILRRNGVAVAETDGGVTVRGPRFAVPLSHAVPMPSGPLCAALLLATLAIPGISRLVVPATTPTYPEAMLRGLGIKLEISLLPSGERVLAVSGLPPLRAQAVTIPSDPQLAAYPLAAALLSPNSDVAVDGVPIDPSRNGLIALLAAMGGRIERHNQRRMAGEEVADVRAFYSAMSGGALSPRLFAPEEAPLLAVVASFAAGETLFETRPDAPSPHALRRALTANGVACREDIEGLWIAGGTAAGGGQVTTRLDPALAMSFLVMGMAADRPVTVDDETAMADLYPDFAEAFEMIGASFSAPP